MRRWRFSPIDAVLIINYLNSVGGSAVPQGAPTGPPFLDTSDDNYVTALDAVLVINYLNGESLGGAAGEPQAALPGLVAEEQEAESDWSPRPSTSRFNATDSAIMALTEGATQRSGRRPFNTRLLSSTPPAGRLQ